MISETTQRCPIKSISVVGSLVLHEKFTHNW